MAKRKPKVEEHENHERWLVSYADFITLLFAFFVVLYSVSRIDNKRMAAAAKSIQWAMHYSGTGGTGHLQLFDGPPSEGGPSKMARWPVPPVPEWCMAHWMDLAAWAMRLLSMRETE